MILNLIVHYYNNKTRGSVIGGIAISTCLLVPGGLLTL